MNPIYITALLTVTLTTNEVRLGTATIGPKTFDVVGLQVVTNRIVQHQPAYTQDAAPMLGERWTNTYPGPFIATNLVERPPVTNWIYFGDIVLTNLLTSTNIFYNVR